MISSVCTALWGNWGDNNRWKLFIFGPPKRYLPHRIVEETYRTKPAGLPAPRWRDQSPPAWRRLPWLYWPAGGSRAASKKVVTTEEERQGATWPRWKRSAGHRQGQAGAGVRRQAGSDRDRRQAGSGGGVPCHQGWAGVPRRQGRRVRVAEVCYGWLPRSECQQWIWLNHQKGG